MKFITIPEFYALYPSLQNDPATLILDVRRPDEFASGHIPGAQNISHEQVPGRASELKKYKKVYLYCRSGGRVQATCHELEQLGLTHIVGVIQGGMPDWIASGYPST